MVDDAVGGHIKRVARLHGDMMAREFLVDGIIETANGNPVGGNGVGLLLCRFVMVERIFCTGIHHVMIFASLVAVKTAQSHIQAVLVVVISLIEGVDNLLVQHGEYHIRFVFVVADYNIIEQNIANQRHKCTRHTVSRAIDDRRKNFVGVLVVGSNGLKPIKIAAHDVLGTEYYHRIEIYVDEGLVDKDCVLNGLGVTYRTVDGVVFELELMVVLGFFEGDAQVRRYHADIGAV